MCDSVFYTEVVRSGGKWLKVQLSTPGNVIPPRGIHETKVDDKGRLKLPAIFQQYLAAFGQREVFCTSLDNRTARVYPISTWNGNEPFFEQAGENEEARRNMKWQADRMGADSAVDDAGRILLPQKLRQPLNLENSTVYLQCERGGINVLSPAEVAKRDAEVAERLAGDLKIALALGLK